jgi:DNA-binding beta-propeller fold protein YncE
MSPTVRSVLRVITVTVISNVLVGSLVHAGGQSAVYVSNKEGSISAFTMNSKTGELTSHPDSPYPAGNFPSWITVDPTNTFAYVSNCGSPSCDLPGSVFGYAIDATGGLSIVSARFTGGRGAISMSIDPSRRFAYVANHGSNNVSGFSISDSGALAPVDGSPFVAGSFPAWVAVDPNGQFLFVANCGSEFCEYPGQTPDGNVAVFRINPGCGALAPVPGSPFRVGQKPIAVAPDATGSFLYVADLGVTGRVHGLVVDRDTGALSPLAGSPWPAGPGPRSITVDPSNQFVYTANINSTTISGYAMDGATGTLAPIVGSPFQARMAPDALAVDGSSRYAYAANFGSANVSAYSIDTPTGRLTPLTRSTFPTGVEPTGVAIVNIVGP